MSYGLVLKLARAGGGKEKRSERRYWEGLITQKKSGKSCRIGLQKSETETGTAYLCRSGRKRAGGKKVTRGKKGGGGRGRRIRWSVRGGVGCNRRNYWGKGSLSDKGKEGTEGLEKGNMRRGVPEGNLERDTGVNDRGGERKPGQNHPAFIWGGWSNSMEGFWEHQAKGLSLQGSVNLGNPREKEGGGGGSRQGGGGKRGKDSRRIERKVKGRNFCQEGAFGGGGKT